MTQASLQGTVLQIQSFSVNDGEGIRTAIFLPGCPLRCRWCANPETWTQNAKLAVYYGKCVGCGKCRAACPLGIFPPEQKPAEMGCTACGECETACPAGALAVLCKRVTVEQVMNKVERESIFHRYSGGGVTFTGGEPTWQQDFLRALTNAFYAQGVSMWMETCGYFQWDNVADILAKMDHLLFDIKCMNDEIHREMTGVSNDLILENCKRAARAGIPITVRIPLIREVNLNRENLEDTARFATENLPDPRVELLPYHDLGKEKYLSLGMEQHLHTFTTPNQEEVLRAREILQGFGIRLAEYK